MEKEIAQGSIGSVGKYEVEFKEGKLVARMEAAGGPLEAGIVIKLDAGKVFDAIADAIPGKYDDVALGMIKAAVLGQ